MKHHLENDCVFIYIIYPINAFPEDMGSKPIVDTDSSTYTCMKKCIFLKIKMVGLGSSCPLAMYLIKYLS